MAEASQRPREGTPPTLLFAIGALLLGVILADTMSPLGLAVWVFYMVPLGACLFSRSPLLPLQVAMVVTALVALLVLKPFGGDALVERWLALGNRSTYVAMLWPVAYMISRLIVSRQAAERRAWIDRTRGALLASLQGELSVEEVASRMLGGLVDALEAPVGALYLRTGPELERVTAQGLELAGTPMSFRAGEGLVGRASLRTGTWVLNDVPPGFMRVQAGIGAGEPRHVALSCLRADGEAVAVTAVLPIIALTAKAMPDDREQALAAGASDYMAKPFEVDKLVSLCRVWLPR